MRFDCGVCKRRLHALIIKFAVGAKMFNYQLAFALQQTHLLISSTMHTNALDIFLHTHSYMFMPLYNIIKE